MPSSTCGASADVIFPNTQTTAVVILMSVQEMCQEKYTWLHEIASDPRIPNEGTRHVRLCLLGNFCRCPPGSGMTFDQGVLSLGHAQEPLRIQHDHLQTKHNAVSQAPQSSSQADSTLLGSIPHEDLCQPPLGWPSPEARVHRDMHFRC